MALGSEIEVQRGGLARRTKPRSFLKSAWVIFREWPVLPGLVMATLVIAAVFAPLIAPTDARTQSLADKNHEPVWLSNPVPTERDIVKGRDPSGLYRLGADAVGYGRTRWRGIGVFNHFDGAAQRGQPEAVIVDGQDMCGRGLTAH